MSSQRLVAIALAVVLGFTLVHYVRRTALPRAGSQATKAEGSRDRALRGKARIRARRAP